MFDSGYGSYLEFVLSGRAPGIDTVVSAIEHAVDQRIDADPNVRRRLVECVQVALITRLPDDLAVRLEARLRFADGESRGRAIERAERRLAESADLRSTVDWLVRFAT